MLPANARAIRFVRALVSGAVAVPAADGVVFTAESDGRRATLDKADVEALQSQGVIAGNGLRAVAGAGARSWLRRAMAETDSFAAQHRTIVRRADGSAINLAESPLSKLATPSADGTAAYLAPHQVEAGERVRVLADRAKLQPRMTTSYSAAHSAGSVGAASDIGDMAIDARRALNEVSRILPADCAGVVLDVCGLLKGLQTVELERGWPRRSAKLVLRIGLEQLAAHYGLAPVAVGKPATRSRAWIADDARPTVFE